MIRPLIRNLLCGALILLLAACQRGEQPASEAAADLTGAADSAAAADAAKLKQIAATLPSPRQAMELLQQAGARYSANLPNNPARTSSYQSSTKAGLNLGVYSADLAYAGAYRQNQQALKYFQSVQKLADQLGVSGAFDAAVLQQLDRNRDNPDSTAAIAARAFEATDRKLRQSGQTDIAKLIVLGGWVEGLYLSSELHALRPNDELALRIAEQKILLTELRELLNGTEASPELKPYLDGFAQLEAAFEPISVQYATGDAKLDPKTNVVSINNRNDVTYTAADLANVRKQAAALRNLITA